MTNNITQNAITVSMENGILLCIFVLFFTVIFRVYACV